ncbi:hypothetical protein ABB37_07593 [Leptomonas pyrrhocoris]|uniref:Uncharacterized protein n=1 Tax=Leptomonas pyrrhocoris TaxID=157538 RepID=A0A0N0VDW5_LEPPY|nr:hypothetical protein ABB37_07593 [Leptomonas pyrrhocoris]KPA76771.1 hypothetical protein ABB37_07593 [Leptomonas pyrrhocoris]|eukprot:XP_015655210.1 hypothetical protein ABB37_07593 [Leptomonas pyrrhocoris]
MDAGSVVNALLARHNAHLNETNAKGALRRARKGQDVATTSARPPPKVMEAVRRGVNPLMLGADLHRTESAAREKAKQKRAGRASSRRTGPSRGRKCDESRRTTNVNSNTLKGESKAAALLPTPRKAALAREEAVSKTLAARHRELRAQPQGEAEERKRLRSTSSTSDVPQRRFSGGADASGSDREGGAAQRARTEQNLSTPTPALCHNKKDGTAAVAKPRRDLWRRRCTIRKILRLSRGVSRATALRRYWYTKLDAGAAQLSSPSADADAPAQEPDHRSKDDLDQTTKTSSRQLAPDAAEATCAARRRRAARRCVLARYHARVQVRRSETETSVAAVITAEEKNGANSVSIPTRRLTRRQYKAGVNELLHHADTEMWGLAIRAVVERREVLQRIASSCTAAVSEKGSGNGGVLPLLLARHFPLFGAEAEVQELEVRAPRVNRRRTRHRRRARYAADNNAGENPSDRNGTEAAASSAARLCVLQRHRGIVVEDYSDTVGVLLLPPSVEGQRAWAAAVQQTCASTSAALRRTEGAAALQRLRVSALSPRVVRVPKHFPGASGALTELLPLMLAATRHRSTRKAGDAFSSATPSPAARSAGTRVLAAIFCGEVNPQLNAMDATPSENRNADATKLSATPNYPLKRLQNRCL